MLSYTHIHAYAIFMPCLCDNADLELGSLIMVSTIFFFLLLNQLTLIIEEICELAVIGSDVDM